MLAILFPHTYEDVEYLLSSEDVDVEMQNVELQEPEAPSGIGLERSLSNMEINATAGPSRLH
jgi:hypothetical protein